ncbi:gamma-glutamyl-gamma-aminobutyrate hydrolase family protein [Algicella marina]|uniref:Gamma-glutamyl-gamma-aminobutyrate hydrolase family protein n=1 Tax=Algicella marina TaxID=2683284 RepID=A0A6P1SX54_9RHOB|nr:gamma-glutamyl-gamma-aminobutyrate hydrolase family protein [Algicella marina]QHQ35028.1 gamma-glutamyl-gamma-aminobutyrate hydrolase family protein [Algicella marina]
MSRPTIGVTVSTRSGWRIFPLVAFNVWLGGGRAVKWTSRREADISSVDGLIVGGGDDISADLYGGELVAKSRVDPERDALEHRLVSEAFEQDKPVLGICRGSQMLNIAAGGTLWQDAYGQFTQSRKVWTILPKKTVRLDPDSRLAAIAGPREMRVNALHSQAVQDLGRNFRAVAHDTGSMIQAIERTRDPFAIGVQWHPEHLFYAHRQRRLFHALVTAAAARRDRRRQVEAVDAVLA